MTAVIVKGPGWVELWVDSNIMRGVYIAASHTAPVHYFSCVYTMSVVKHVLLSFLVQELCESRGGRPGLSILTSLLPVSVDVKIY